MARGGAAASNGTAAPSATGSASLSGAATSSHAVISTRMKDIPSHFSVVGPNRSGDSDRRCQKFGQRGRNAGRGRDGRPPQQQQQQQQRLQDTVRAPNGNANIPRISDHASMVRDLKGAYVNDELRAASPRTLKLIDNLHPVLEYYNYSKPDVLALLKRSEYKQDLIELEVARVMDESRGHEQGSWETVKSKQQLKQLQHKQQQRQLQAFRQHQVQFVGKGTRGSRRSDRRSRKPEGRLASSERRRRDVDCEGKSASHIDESNETKDVGAESSGQDQVQSSSIPTQEQTSNPVASEQLQRPTRSAASTESAGARTWAARLVKPPTRVQPIPPPVIIEPPTAPSAQLQEAVGEASESPAVAVLQVPTPKSAGVASPQSMTPDPQGEAESNVQLPAPADTEPMKPSSTPSSPGSSKREVSPAAPSLLRSRSPSPASPVESVEEVCNGRRVDECHPVVMPGRGLHGTSPRDVIGSKGLVFGTVNSSFDPFACPVEEPATEPEQPPVAPPPVAPVASFETPCQQTQEASPATEPVTQEQRAGYEAPVSYAPEIQQPAEQEVDRILEVDTSSRKTVQQQPPPQVTEPQTTAITQPQNQRIDVDPQPQARGSAHTSNDRVQQRRHHYVQEQHYGQQQVQHYNQQVQVNAAAAGWSNAATDVNGSFNRSVGSLMHQQQPTNKPPPPPPATGIEGKSRQDSQKGSQHHYQKGSSGGGSAQHQHQQAAAAAAYSSTHAFSPPPGLAPNLAAAGQPTAAAAYSYPNYHGLTTYPQYNNVYYGHGNLMPHYGLMGSPYGAKGGPAGLPGGYLPNYPNLPYPHQDSFDDVGTVGGATGTTPQDMYAPVGNTTGTPHGATATGQGGNAPTQVSGGTVASGQQQQQHGVSNSGSGSNQTVTSFYNQSVTAHLGGSGGASYSSASSNSSVGAPPGFSSASSYQQQIKGGGGPPNTSASGSSGPYYYAGGISGGGGNNGSASAAGGFSARSGATATEQPTQITSNIQSQYAHKNGNFKQQFGGQGYHRNATNAAEQQQQAAAAAAAGGYYANYSAYSQYAQPPGLGNNYYQTSFQQQNQNYTNQARQNYANYSNHSMWS